MAGILKTDPVWTTEYTAVGIALHLEAFVSEFARLWRHHETLVQTLSFVVIWIEWTGPIIALVPRIWARTLGVGSLIVLEVGILASLEVGLFPFISIISLIPLIPGVWLDMLERRRPKDGTGWTLFYDPKCRFCLFACRVLKAASGWQKAGIETAKEGTEAGRILEEESSWSIKSEEMETGISGWDAVREVFGKSRRRSLNRFLPNGAKGKKAYLWIGRNRERFGALGSWLVGNERKKVGTPVGEGVALSALIVVIIWNIATYPSIREEIDLRGKIIPIAAGFNLMQYWSMFAASPYKQDWWIQAVALSKDGEVRAIPSDREVGTRTEIPVDGPEYYGGYRWRKLLNGLHLKGKMNYILKYWCGLGKWQAVSITVWYRPSDNPWKTPATKYRIKKKWDRRCPGANREETESFTDRINGMRAKGPVYKTEG